MTALGTKVAALVAESFKRTGELESCVALGDVMDRVNSARAIILSHGDARMDVNLRQALWSFIRGDVRPLERWSKDIHQHYDGQTFD